MNCPHHPEIALPDKLTCPLCAQEQRRAAYAQQRAEMARYRLMAAQELLRLGMGHTEDQS